MDSYDVKNNINTIKGAFEFQGPSVVISRRSCALHGDRIKRRNKIPIIQNEVDKTICKKPHTCIRDFHCPAITFDLDDRASHIQPEICDGCGVCAQICPFNSIHPIGSQESKTQEPEVAQ
jgi:indolepyruvate ferredoxin oxidoreductase alpha subunit